jgi:hypothetical protein
MAANELARRNFQLELLAQLKAALRLRLAPAIGNENVRTFFMSVK